MTQRPWLLHPEVLVELREAAEWYEERGAGIGEDFVAAVERCLEKAASHAYPGTHVPYLKRADVRWLLLTPRFPYAVILLLDPRTVIAVSHLHRKPAHWHKRLPRRAANRQG